MELTAGGTFEISMTPTTPELEGSVGRFDFTKTWSGGVEGTGHGVFLSCGDPANGEAGYVALETVAGSVDQREGSLVLAQLGTMHAGSQELHYTVVPGSGSGGLAGITGTLLLRIDDDGTHQYELTYELS